MIVSYDPSHIRSLSYDPPFCSLLFIHAPHRLGPRQIMTSWDYPPLCCYCYGWPHWLLRIEWHRTLTVTLLTSLKGINCDVLSSLFLNGIGSLAMTNVFFNSTLIISGFYIIWNCYIHVWFMKLGGSHDCCRPRAITYIS